MNVLEAWCRYRKPLVFDELVDVHVAYCPMVDRHWLQKGRTISNPFDTSMPRCGTIKE